MVSDSQTHKKVLGGPETDTLTVKDDPRLGARLKDSERKETKSGPSDTSPTKKVTGDNVSNDLRTPAGRIRKDNEQQDKTIKRKKELADPNMTVDDKMSYDPCTSAVTVSKDSE